MNSGNKIRMLREEKAMTQEDLALAAGYKTRSSIAKIESGDSDPSQKMLIRIANALNVSPAELLDDENRPTIAAPNQDSPSTPEFRIISGGIYKLSQPEQKHLLSVLRAMYANNPDLFPEGDETNDPGL